MIIAITGDCSPKRRLEMRLVKRLNNYKKKIELIIEGGAKGIDEKAFMTEQLLGIQVCTFHANWEKFGRAAGPIRNKNQIRFIVPDECWAFHSNIKKSKGTANMVKLAKKAEIKVRLFR